VRQGRTAKAKQLVFITPSGAILELLIDGLDFGELKNSMMSLVQSFGLWQERCGKV
jgi:hypothetical protein